MPITLVPPRPGASKYWRIRGTYLGVKVNRSTGSDTRSVTAKVLKATLGEIERGRFQKPLGPTFADAVTRYVREGKDARFLEKLVLHFGEKPLDEIDQKAIEDAAFALYPTATNATRNRQVFTPMSAVLQHSGVDMRLKRPAGANGETRDFFLRPGQAEALIDAAWRQEEEFGVFLMFLLYTGLRLAEACRVRVEDVELQHAQAFCGKTKNGLPRRVHLPPPLVAAIANHPRGLERSGKLFRYYKGSKMYEAFQRAAEASGVIIPPGVAFHAFRHSFGAWMRRYGGLDTTGLVATGAWKSADAARRYEHADVSEAARASDLFPAIGRVKSV